MTEALPTWRLARSIKIRRALDNFSFDEKVERCAFVFRCKGNYSVVEVPNTANNPSRFMRVSMKDYERVRSRYTHDPIALLHTHYGNMTPFPTDIDINRARLNMPGLVFHTWERTLIQYLNGVVCDIAPVPVRPAR